MAIERKTLPYEILLRFNFEPQFGPLGIFRGAHYIESEALVDEKTGEVLSYKPGTAQELPSDMATKYFGAAFAQFDAAHNSLVSQLREAATVIEAQKADLASHANAIEALKAENEGLKAAGAGTI